MVQQNILIDEALNDKLQVEGFVVLPLLEEAEINELTSFFKEKKTVEAASFYATAHASELSFRREMSNKIVEVIQEKAAAYFQNHELLGASYIVKSKGLNQALQPHQDWNIVDESVHRSYNVWIPLVDLDEENGAILVMPKSHSWINNYRHSSIACSFQEVHGQIWENMKPLFLKAGEALIYDHALLHASMPNTSQTDRIACACGVIPQGAQMKFYWNNKGSVEEYESSKEFFLTENIFSGPNGLKKIKDVNFEFVSIDENKFYTLAKIENLNSIAAENLKDNNLSEINPREPFWKVYSIPNIIKEIISRVK